MITLERVYGALKALAALSGLVAFFSLAVTYSKDVALRQDAANQGWLEAETFHVLFEAGLEGLKLDQVVSKIGEAYFSAGLAAGIDAEVGRAEQVRRALIGLAAKNAAVINNDGTVSVNAQPKEMLRQDFVFSQRIFFENEVFKLVAESPGRYTSLELRQKIEAMGASPRVAHQIVGSMVFMQPPLMIPAGDNPATLEIEERYSPTAKLKLLE